MAKWSVHIGLVLLTIGSRSAVVPSFDVAERRLAFLVAVVLADMSLSIIIFMFKSNVLCPRQSDTFSSTVIAIVSCEMTKIR